MITKNDQLIDLITRWSKHLNMMARLDQLTPNASQKLPNCFISTPKCTN